MEINIQEKTKTYLRFQAKENPHTLFNLLKETVLQNEGVKLCGYARDETFEDSVVFQIQTEEKFDPIKILFDSVQQLKQENKKFRDLFAEIYAPK